MAQFSIPNAELGLYTTHKIPANTLIGVEPIVPTSDLSLHNASTFGQLDKHLSIRDYVWNDDYSGAKLSESPLDYLGMNGIMGSLANSHPGLVNLKHVNLHLHDGFGYHRSIFPANGAVTPYHNAQYIAMQDDGGKATISGDI
eukprot:CAMPEP_0171292892 /NCGR_PEP_ID=MMETSP0816-20121228/905_1 /TAXON_ID=420281 /ORGANISM="Proboscia inermis, Strain CCAP1064/1" /LENGTH=142 /DNA_ID=CAMNT_0011763105 /DNA_START=985 /DNA_END=1413 /DNA_ORIENTATION=-